MVVQRCDIRDACGHFAERYLQLLAGPVLNEAGDLSLIVHQIIDVTAQSIGGTSGVA
ncbi:hypothetical protein ACVWW1_007565 [Bradyrhizobium sp. JR3.5]